MSALKQRMAKAGARVALVACVVAALLAVSGAGASSASAACTKGTLQGQGASLQNVAQNQIWIPHWNATEECGPGNPEQYAVAYESTGSGAGLAAWDFTAPGGGINLTRQFIGTDDAPTAAQIGNARGQANNANVVVVPVAQTSIAIVTNLPEECEFGEEPEGITNEVLEKAFNGEAETWAELGAEGACCTATLTRVVRKDASGTTYQFKNYLAKIKGWNEGEEALNEAAPCAGESKWSELQPIVGAGGPNLEWPECGEMAVERPANTGGGAVAATVAAMSGSIGYAALADAKGNGAEVALVQNGEFGGEPTFAAPGKEENPAGTEGFANCTNAVYVVPPEGRTAGTGLNVDWSQVFGGNPTIGGATYSICTITYDLAWRSYALAGFPGGAETGTGVREYLDDVVTNGTLATVKKWYASLPSPVAEANDVQDAAEYAVGLVQ